MTSSARTFRSLMIGAWILLVPPVPLGTSLPPLSQWTPKAKVESAEECERLKDAARDEAGRTITADPNASALKVAAALGQLRATCLEIEDAEPAQPPVAGATADESAPAGSE